jgi:hypothetical protein
LTGFLETWNEHDFRSCETPLSLDDDDDDDVVDDDNNDDGYMMVAVAAAIFSLFYNIFTNLKGDAVIIYLQPHAHKISCFCLI